MRVSKIDVLDFGKQSRLTALQVLQQCATRLLSRMPHAWNKAMQSSLHKGGIQQITQWPFHLLVVETCSITLQTADMPDPIQHISMQEHIAADAPERRAPVKGGMLVADGRQQSLHSRMAIVVSQQIHPRCRRIQSNRFLQPCGCSIQRGIETAKLTPAEIKHVSAKNNRLCCGNRIGILIPVPLTNRTVTKQMQVREKESGHNVVSPV